MHIYYTINAVFFYYLWYCTMYKRQYTDKTLTLWKSMNMRASGTSELRKFRHFYIIKVLFLSIWMGVEEQPITNKHFKAYFNNAFISIFVGSKVLNMYAWFFFLLFLSIWWGGTENLSGGGGGTVPPRSYAPGYRHMSWYVFQVQISFG